MKNYLVVAAMATALISIGGCSSGPFASGCIVTSTGSKLCGDDAKAWCDSTDAIRSSADDLLSDPDYGDSKLAGSVAESQSACDDLRG